MHHCLSQAFVVPRLVIIDQVYHFTITIRFSFLLMGSSIHFTNHHDKTTTNQGLRRVDNIIPHLYQAFIVSMLVTMNQDLHSTRG